MSTVVLTLVVVGGSIAVAVKLVRSEGMQPATDDAVPHRGRAKRRADDRPVRQRRRRRRRRATAAPESAAVVDSVAPRPGLLLRLRAGIMLVAVVALIGATIALGLVAGVEVISRAVEQAVN